jgi:hypothetical protein
VQIVARANQRFDAVFGFGYSGDIHYRLASQADELLLGLAEPGRKLFGLPPFNTMLTTPPSPSRFPPRRCCGSHFQDR